ncbi:MAG: cytochrome c [Proteobacteria bacterium]|nr:cytochrome c [Pseudomonadota bacterium]
MKVKLFVLVGLISLLSPLVYAKSTILTWNTDMYNQKNIKPQEKGSMLRFPEGVVSVDGRNYETAEEIQNWIGLEMDPESATKNPVKVSTKSLEQGKKKYFIYCSICHGPGGERAENGLAKSKINEKGMIAPVMLDLTPAFTDGYLYGKIRYGGAIMPPLGYATTARERWDIINYIRTMEKQ